MQSFDAVSKASRELRRAIFHVMLLENAMGKGQGPEWERAGHILIGLGHHDNIGSLRSPSLLCKNKHLLVSCLGKSRATPPAADAPAFLPFLLLPRPSLYLSIPANWADPTHRVHHPKKPLCLLQRPL